MSDKPKCRYCKQEFSVEGFKLMHERRCGDRLIPESIGKGENK